MYLRSPEACVLLCAISWCGVWSLVFEVRTWSSRSQRDCWVCLQWTSSVMAGTLMYFWGWAPHVFYPFCPWLWAVMVMLAELIVRPIVCSLSRLVWILVCRQVSLMADSIQKYLENMNIFFEDDTPVTRPSEPCQDASCATCDATSAPCAICFESKKISGPPLSVCGGCGKTFHTHCIQQWTQRGHLACPLCRWEHGIVPIRWS